MCAALHRAKRNATDLSRFLIRQALSRNQDQSFPVLDRELRERFEHIGKVTPGLLLRWCPQPSGMVPVRVLKLASRLSVLAVERVPQDREQPRMEVRVWLEPIEVGP